MTVAEFIAKWERVELKERSAAQEHFLDLCHLVDHDSPASLDPTGGWFTFERGVSKAGGGEGWADVWKREYFGWEYKGRHRDLNAAYLQFLSRPMSSGRLLARRRVRWTLFARAGCPPPSGHGKKH